MVDIATNICINFFQQIKKLKDNDFMHFLRMEQNVKFRYYEKATKFEKNLSPVLTKQLFLLSSVKTSGIFFQICVAFSENLNFKISSEI